jgi:MFS family permease
VTSSGTAIPQEAVLRARNAVFVVFAVNGFMLASWIARLPTIKAMLHLSPGRLSILLLAISIGALIGLPIAGRLLHRFGPVKVVRIGGALVVVGVVAAAVGVTAHWSVFAIAPFLVFVGFGSGTWDVAQNLEGSVVEQAQGRSVMPWFHAFFSGGTVAAALIAVVLIKLHVSVLAHMIGVAIVSAAALAWATVRFMTPPPSDEPAHERTPALRQWSAWLEPRTLLIGLMVLAAAFTEGVANDWMAVGFVDGHGVSVAGGVTASAVFLVFMTAGRILGTGLLDRFGRIPVLRVMFTCAFVGSMLVVFGTTPMAYLGAAIWGLGASLGFPVGMSAASDDPARAAVRLSVVATIGYAAFFLGPTIIGVLGDHVGVLRALTVVGVVALLALLVVPAARPLQPTETPGTTV